MKHLILMLEYDEDDKYITLQYFQDHMSRIEVKIVASSEDVIAYLDEFGDQRRLRRRVVPGDLGDELVGRVRPLGSAVDLDGDVVLRLRGRRAEVRRDDDGLVLDPQQRAAWSEFMAFQVSRARALLFSGAPLGKVLKGRIGLEMRVSASNVGRAPKSG